MLNRQHNELLCRVGPDTPMGTMMRRYWHPVCTSAQLAERDAPPLRVRLLGEDYVAFRDSEGRVGVMEELCMHRGASLALGRVEEGGIRCLYHGWKFSVDGAVLDTPNNEDPKYRAKMKAPSFPVREEGGIVWAYVGPKELEPPFSRYAFMDSAPEHRVVLRINVNCNYLQLVEGGEDTRMSACCTPTWPGPAGRTRSSSATWTRSIPRPSRRTIWSRPSRSKTRPSASSTSRCARPTSRE